jgi:hypothetical protein
MIVFIDEEHAYRYWVTHHRNGFVIDGRFRPRVGHLMLHRATCAEIKPTASNRSHRTTGGRFKACSVDLSHLREWPQRELQCEVTSCETCRPLDELMQHTADAGTAGITEPPLTHFASEILEYVIEAAVIHFEWTDGPRYRLTLGDIAACMNKTVGQLGPALRQLQHAGYLEVPGKHTESTRVFPTLKAIQSTPGFQTDTPECLQRQLDALRG